MCHALFLISFLVEGIAVSGPSKSQLNSACDICTALICFMTWHGEILVIIELYTSVLVI